MRAEVTGRYWLRSGAVDVGSGLLRVGCLAELPPEVVHQVFDIPCYAECGLLIEVDGQSGCLAELAALAPRFDMVTAITDGVGEVGGWPWYGDDVAFWLAARIAARHCAFVSASFWGDAVAIIGERATIEALIAE
ncbi:MAG: hypothetical protein HZB16_10100 [Armatimonadetes bacterium]|nr:hypothetical protein [Armatimonadota bacterium]